MKVLLRHHFERSEESSVDASLRLRFVQHDKGRKMYSERREESIARILLPCMVLDGCACFMRLLRLRCGGCFLCRAAIFLLLRFRMIQNSIDNPCVCANEQNRT